MWTRKHYVNTNKVEMLKVWNLCIDVDNWSQWDFNILYARKNADDQTITVKHRKFPQVEGKIVKYVEQREFKIMFKLPFAKLFRTYHFDTTENGLKISITTSVQGFLSVIWIFTVAIFLDHYTKEDIDIIIQKCQE